MVESIMTGHRKNIFPKARKESETGKIE